MSLLVYTENWNGKFKKLSLELVSYASGVGEIMNSDVIALTIGPVEEDELMRLAEYGASRIIVAEHDALKEYDTLTYASVITQLAEKEGSDVIVLANNNQGKGVAPVIAARLAAGLAAGVTGLPVSVDPFRIDKRAYSGNAMARLEIKTAVRILTLAQNSYDLKSNRRDAVIEKYQPVIENSPAIKIEDVQRQEGKLLLTDAEIVVSGGRGMKSPDNWVHIEELASLLGGATACSRPVSDEGWRPHGEHTGQTGKVIAPNLYIAAGISGATQHIAGVSSSKYIVAINSDKDAPIFEVAQYGIVGDALKVLPALVAAVKAAKND
ncbi:MAG: electron transfer flavoprotein subunit alpha/FixB family protein [Bacteroidales bacterium]|nr:electron transfer flavoprotein subunit alpha/FixB family protein [Bacteroidales bacterium]